MASTLAPPGAAATSPDSTRHVYDQAGVLTPDEIEDLEARARAIHQLGPPAIVYLARERSSYEETVRDARGLMDAWNVQSAPDARDGIVVRIDLRPRSKRGTYAIVAGESLIRGRIPQRELDAISEDMRPLLRSGEFREAIAFALDRMEKDLREGPPPLPPPTAAQRFARHVAGGVASPMNVVAVAMAAVGILLALRWSPPSRGEPAASSTPHPPSSLPPALAGALVNGAADQAGVAATLLDLAKRGALVIEPEPGKKKEARIRLRDGQVAQAGFERKLWDLLASRAEGNVVPSASMAELEPESGEIQEEIRRDLVDRGWLDPEASRKRRPMIRLALGLFLLAGVATILAVIARSPSAAIGVAALTCGAVVALIATAHVPDRTQIGDQVAAPWLGYRRHIRQVGKHPDTHLDIETAVPYALAFGVGASLNKRLQAASERGELPTWFGPGEGYAAAGGFYPYWVTFSTSVAPSAAGGTSGGASSGSGASGGSF